MHLHICAPAHHLSAHARDAQIAVLCRHGGFASVERQKVYFFGIIDVLERYSLRWKAQRLVLTAGYHLLMRAPDAAGTPRRCNAGPPQAPSQLDLT